MIKVYLSKLDNFELNKDTINCSYPDKKCPGSNSCCSVNQCCPGIYATNNPTFPCTPSSNNLCEGDLPKNKCGKNKNCRKSFNYCIQNGGKPKMSDSNTYSCI